MEQVTGNIANAEMAKSGKSVRLNINDKWFSSKHFELMQKVGQVITFTPSATEYPSGSGKMYYWVNDYTEGVVGAATASSAQAPQPTTSEQDFNPHTLLPMTSNVVAHAIQAGAIKEAQEIRVWARAAFDAAKDLVSPNRDELDDDIPF
jgi:hypothetical protein